MKKKYKRAGTTSERQDYRQGGQVSKDGPRQKFYPGGAQGDGDIGLSNFDIANFPLINIPPAPVFTPTPVQTPSSNINILPRSSGENMAMTEQQKAANRAKVEQAAAGQVPVAGQIPAVQQVDANIQQQGTTMPTATTVGQTQVTATPTEQVTTIQPPQTVATPTVAPVATVQPAQITEAPTVTAAQTTLADEELAKIAGVERIQPIDAAEVKVREGAVAERVVGQISPQSIATAAQASGTTLARVTRAKKQLRTAGLDEATITELGDNPEALEDRLTDFTEAQRGVIEGLPQEALVSNQLDTLLKGIENGQIPTWAQPAVAAVEQM